MLTDQNPSPKPSPFTDKRQIEPIWYSGSFVHKRFELGGWTNEATEPCMVFSQRRSYLIGYTLSPNMRALCKIVKFALQRPYTFVIVALLIAVFGIASILKTPTGLKPSGDWLLVPTTYSRSPISLKREEEVETRLRSQVLSSFPDRISGIHSRVYALILIIGWNI